MVRVAGVTTLVSRRQEGEYRRPLDDGASRGAGLGLGKGGSGYAAPPATASNRQRRKLHGVHFIFPLPLQVVSRRTCFPSLRSCLPRDHWHLRMKHRHLSLFTSASVRASLLAGPACRALSGAEFLTQPDKPGSVRARGGVCNSLHSDKAHSVAFGCVPPVNPNHIFQMIC